MNPPAFQFYADDFIGGVADMTQAEVGAYILLLCHEWSRGEIPTDPERLRLIAKGDVGQHVLAKFPGGKNPRMEQVRAEQAAFRGSKSVAGKAGADKRWHSHASAIGKRMAQPMANAWQTDGTAIVLPMANGMANDSSPSPTPTPITLSLGAPEKEIVNNSEVPDLPQAKAMVMADGIPDEFVALVHADWTGNGGRNGAGQAMPWTNYVRKRWRYECQEWRSGTHRAQRRQKTNGGPNAAHGGPSLLMRKKALDELRTAAKAKLAKLLPPEGPLHEERRREVQALRRPILDELASYERQIEKLNAEMAGTP